MPALINKEASQKQMLGVLEYVLQVRRMCCRHFQWQKPFEVLEKSTVVFFGQIVGRSSILTSNP